MTAPCGETSSPSRSRPVLLVHCCWSTGVRLFSRSSPAKSASMSPRLLALLARHPSVALRIADVTDGDSPLAQGEFGNQTYVLPLVIVFDANRRKIKTLSGSPALIVTQLAEFLKNY